ncbi:MAG: hypothetical protein NVS9B7_29310 [Flavisolibacter sp.]
MKTKEILKIEIESFSGLGKNWDSYNADEISICSIMNAHKVIDSIPEFLDLNMVNVYPMRNGGVQIDIGEFKEIEINGSLVAETTFDLMFNISNRFIYEIL